MTSATKVGPKGQVVITKEIRDQLGIRPGSLAVQRIVDGHVELYFIERHRRSLKGILASYVKRSLSEDEFHQAAEDAWAEAAREHLNEQDD
ncbi:MAG TPA: AbrB/MazE/SpoVT family DNA-binding domain-containing protein [Chloroflexota bacterium]|jgi:AbrB family looped-hinge helix DNA binding protein|nr:AbrB/MazE/SpoVT family DNA-binding domain-containing protein [Chloroflexota bacterium]